MKKLLSILALIPLFYQVNAQVTTWGNIGLSTDYVGWDVNQTFPLEIKHEGTFPINFYTSGNLFGVPGTFDNMRMRIFEDNILDPRNNTWNVGRVGIRESQRGWNTNPVPPGIPVPIEPASLLHLGEGWPRGQGGHRLWMDVGTYTTAGSDMLYTGIKLQSPRSAIPWTDQMDAVVG